MSVDHLAPASTAAPAPSLAELFLAFLRLGATAFGGPAMVAYIRRLAVAGRGWLDEAAFLDGVALCQTIPGATVRIFTGLSAVVVALIANAACDFARRSITSWRAAALAGGAAAMLVLRVNPILVIAGCGLLGAWLIGHAGRNRTSPCEPSWTTSLFMPTLVLVLAGVAAAVMLCWWDRRLFDLAVTMIRVDLAAFGGGFASVPLMRHEAVVIRGWMDSRTFMDGIALGQVTPGPIVITATFVGSLTCGFAGALVATLSVFFPSFVMVTLLAPYFDRLQRHAAFRGATSGALLSFVGLLAAVTVQFALAASWTVATTTLGVLAFVALRLKVDVLWVVLAGVLLSLLLVA